MSVGQFLDRTIYRQQPMTLWGVPIIIGLMLIWSSSLFQIDYIFVPPLATTKASSLNCFSGGKQVGLYSTLNWTLVYILLFPVFLICCWSLARLTRHAIDEIIDHRLIKDTNGNSPTKEIIHALLDRELKNNDNMFICLAISVLLLSVLGWWYSCGHALWRFDLGRSVVDWSTVIIRCNMRDMQYPVFFYTLVAYIWMGLALFVYLACLFLGFIYASFWSQLALASENEGDSPWGSDAVPHHTSAYVLFFEPSIFVRYASKALLVYFSACVFGLLAGYLMRFESQYLLSSATTIFEYFTGNYREWWHPSALSGLRYQNPDTSNQTLFLGLTVTGATLVSLAGTTWMVVNAFYGAKQYTLRVAARLESIADDAPVVIAEDDLSSLQRIRFLPSVLPEWPILAAILAVVVYATLSTYNSIWALIVGSVLLLVAVGWVQLRRRAQERASAIDTQGIGGRIESRQQLEKIVNEHSNFINFSDFISALARLEAAVCAIEIPGGGGTGFLVAADLVITNYHVIEKIKKGEVSPSQVVCRFDFLKPVDASGVAVGRGVGLSRDEWLVAHRRYGRADLTGKGQWAADELDYAVLRLGEGIGDQPWAQSAFQEARRGWISLVPPTAAVATEDSVLVVQHPQDLTAQGRPRSLPMQIAIGTVLGYVGAERACATTPEPCRGHRALLAAMRTLESWRCTTLAIPRTGPIFEASSTRRFRLTVL